MNTTTVGNQFDASVAMDADGDFVVVWEGNGVGDNAGVFAQRFNALGRKVGGEFLVNTANTTNQQGSPAVAMDSYGNFVIVWASMGQSFAYFNEIDAQIYDFNGQAVGTPFKVNANNLPNTPTDASQVHPQVAISDGTSWSVTDDSIVVTWDAITAKLNGVETDSVVMGRRFAGDGSASTIMGSTTEVQLSVGGVGGTPTTRAARNAQVAMDPAGDFTVVWESYQDADNSFGVYASRFLADGTPDMVDEQANMVLGNALFAGAQVNPSIAIDADGAYQIVWDGNGATPDATDPTNLNLVSNADSQGIFIRSFTPSNNPEYAGVQSLVNTTTAGVQNFPSIAMTPEGNSVVVWSGNGIGDQQGIFFRRYTVSSDTVGPTVTGATLVSASGNQYPLGDNTLASTDKGVKYVIIDVSEALYDNLTQSGDAASNPANYALYISPTKLISGGIAAVGYGFDEAYKMNVTSQSSGKYQIVLTIDSDPTTAGATAVERLLRADNLHAHRRNAEQSRRHHGNHRRRREQTRLEQSHPRRIECHHPLLDSRRRQHRR